MNKTKNFFNDKNLINDYMNVWAMIHNTPDEELSEMGKNTKLWLELNGGYEKTMATFRDFRNDL